MVSGVNYHMPPFKPACEIDQWIEKLEDYIMACHGEECSDLRKLAILKTVMGKEAKAAVNNFSAAEKDTYAKLKAKLLSYYRPAVNPSTYRHQFYSLYQEQGETVNDFLN